ncbi:MAG: shikimate kinase [Cenarchaeum symbiont of Oopsacas minuta]|nr:shikimate kinase [Cenarchaeum symbiont of Oopsacas minuta]
MADTVRARVYGAISLVNAIAAKKGATLGVDLVTEATVTKSNGSGIYVKSKSERLVSKTVKRSISKRLLKSHKITVSLSTQIPAGYGLKSSSAISTAVALACAKLFSKKIDDDKVIRAGVAASMDAGVSITGAYDDACACYYGGFCVTDNWRKKLVVAKKAPRNLHAVIYIPYKRARGNPKRLRQMSKTFRRAWEMARLGDYWNAMILNGVAASSILNTDPKLIGALVGAGALGVSVSGNGPAVAAVAKKPNITKVKKQFTRSQGRIITMPINCKKAHVYVL